MALFSVNSGKVTVTYNSCKSVGYATAPNTSGPLNIPSQVINPDNGLTYYVRKIGVTEGVTPFKNITQITELNISVDPNIQGAYILQN